MKIYIAGKVTGEKPFHYMHKFGYAATKLREQGHSVINPLEINEPLNIGDFTYEDKMALCFAAIDICDAVYMLDDWPYSPGARREHEYALNAGKKIIYQNVEE